MNDPVAKSEERLNAAQTILSHMDVERCLGLSATAHRAENTYEGTDEPVVFIKVRFREHVCARALDPSLSVDAQILDCIKTGVASIRELIEKKAGLHDLFFGHSYVAMTAADNIARRR